MYISLSGLREMTLTEEGLGRENLLIRVREYYSSTREDQDMNQGVDNGNRGKGAY